MDGVSRRIALGGLAALAAPSLSRARPTSFAFGTNWIAQAEHGGFYQALADGTYARHDLDVRIVQGGPNVNNRALLAAGRIDAFMGGSMLQAFAAVEQGIPTVAVAAIFQRDPQAILAHPGRGVERWEDLKRIPLLISRTGEATFYRWMIAAHGFRPEQVRPYTFNAGPFCADPGVGQQGFVTAEPFAVERACGFRPNVFLLADQGWDTYSTIIEVRRETLETRADAVERFVRASVQGWKTWLAGDRAAGSAAIKRDNPDMSDAQIAYSAEAMRRHGLVLPGDPAQDVGAMAEARVHSFFERMASAGLVRANIEWRRAFDPRFVGS
jgi:NitT/TauT family transport system substrate-binding protein